MQPRDRQRGSLRLWISAPEKGLIAWSARDFAFTVNQLPTTGPLPVGSFGAVFALVVVLGDVTGQAASGLS
jgi:hypothetical protein